MPLQAPLPLDRAQQAFALPADGLYLDCAAQGPPLRAARDIAAALLENEQDATEGWAGNAGSWRARIESVRALAATFFDDDADGVALVPSAGYGLSLAARNLPLHAGEAVLLLDGQFPSNLLPWRQRCLDSGARLVFAERGVAGRDWTQTVLHALDAEPGIAILALPQAHWIDGSLLDLDRIAPYARERGARLVLDLSQSLGALPVRLHAWQPEFVVSVGYKWLLGPYGLAYLWAAPHWRDAGQPLEQGWMGYDNDVLWQGDADATPETLIGARRFDAGGVCDARRLALAGVGLHQVLAWSREGLAETLRARISALANALRGQGLGDWLPHGELGHFCGLRPPTALVDPLAARLRAEGMVFTLRRGCLRIAPHLHVGAREMVALAARIAA
ncbi:MAG: aminotransferase class V-fold PLP-dependent enzyme, partial [Luteimonas sp.]